MSINYAPMLLNKQKAFRKDDGDEISILLQDNFMISSSEILGYRLKFISGYTTTELFTQDIIITNFKLEEFKEIKFDISSHKDKIQENEYYRVQVAYLTLSPYGVGIYSNMAVVKSIKLPVGDNLKLEVDDNFLTTFTFNPNENTEKLSSVQFMIEGLEQSEIIYGNYNPIIAYQFKYYSNNVNPYFIDKNGEKIKQNINLILTIKAKYITTDNYEGILSCQKTITENHTENYDYNVENSKIEINHDDGLISFNGDFIKAQIFRTQDNTDYVPIVAWEKIYDGTNKVIGIVTDETLQSGCSYSYLIKLPEKTYMAKNIVINYEDSFLFDNELSFKIKYNPKMSSFKQNVQEAKVQTIGSQFPFFFRNGNVKYHEFPLSGLISYIPSVENKIYYPERGEKNIYSKDWENLQSSEVISDQNGLVAKFYFDSSIGYQNYYDEGYQVNGFLSEADYVKMHEQAISTQLTADNIYREKEYKIKILNWLNNGKPKVFKSPTEGNFIVQLSGVSLSPEDKLGRMLHSFNCTAVEIDEYNLKNLKKYNIIKEG